MGGLVQMYTLCLCRDSPSPKAMRDEIVDFQVKDKISLKPLRESINSKIYPLTPSLKDEFAFQLVDKLSMQPGDVMFKRGVLGIDLDGNAVADMKINLPGVTAFDSGNLIV